ASAINASGQVVGVSGDYAMLWQNGRAAKLPSLTGTGLTVTSASAAGINDSGVIVGRTSGYGGAILSSFVTATVWENGTAIDLNSLLPASYTGSRLTSAYAID